MPTHNAFVSALGITALLACGPACLAGDTNPPAGPVAGTMKTLQEVEPRTPIDSLPYTINTPGSYYLTGNLSGTGGIFIGASNVTLDLMGFTLDGAAAVGTPDAIHGDGSTNEVTVRNGFVTNWPGHGVNFEETYDTVVEDVRIQGCAAYGIFGGNRTIVRRCTVRDCTQNGIGLWIDALVEGCTVTGSGQDGIFVGDGSTVKGCNVTGSAGNGISAANSCTITGCTVRSSTANGFEVDQSSLVSCCSSNDNSEDGFRGTSGCSFAHCNAKGNRHGFIGGANANITSCSALLNIAYGIVASSSSRFTDCTSSSNGTHGFGVSDGSTAGGCSAVSNGSNGFTIGAGCTVSGCTAQSNASDGFSVSWGSTITGCATRFNTGDGIVGYRCTIIGNSCISNGYNGDGAGIHVTNSDARIEGNTVIDNDRGIDVDGTGNVVVCNMSRNNTTDYDIVAGNDVGPIGTAAASTSPWANIQ